MPLHDGQQLSNASLHFAVSSLLPQPPTNTSYYTSCWEGGTFYGSVTAVFWKQETLGSAAYTFFTSPTLRERTWRHSAYLTIYFQYVRNLLVLADLFWLINKQWVMLISHINASKIISVLIWNGSHTWPSGCGKKKGIIMSSGISKSAN